MSLAGQWMAEHGGCGTKESSIATKKKIRFVDLVRPPHNNVIYGMHVAIAFELFRWMVVTGDPYRSTGYPSAGVRELLGLHVGCVNFSGVDGFGHDWKDDLRKRFQYALLDPYSLPSIEKWRKDFGIHVEASRIVPIRYRKPMWEADISSHTCCGLLDRILKDIPGSKLKKQLNKYYADACWVQGITLAPSTYYKRWIVSLSYGFKKDCGSWGKMITIQGKKELFTDFLLRTGLKLKKYIDCRTWDSRVRDGWGFKKPIEELRH